MRVPSYSQLNDFYGDPDINDDGQPDAAWESANLTTIVPPYPMIWSWSLKPVKSIRIHKKCAESLFDALEQIGKDLPHNIRAKAQLDRCGGGYNFRAMRLGSRLSTHSWGCAIDLAPDLNWLGRKYSENAGMMPKVAVKAFESRGWVWGGKWTRPDAMHFQYCR